MWQPIETAPKNGDRLDLGSAYTTKDGLKFLRAPDCYWHKKKASWMCKWYGRDGYSAIQAPFNPTHWMPLPDPPHA